MMIETCSLKYSSNLTEINTIYLIINSYSIKNYLEEGSNHWQDLRIIYNQLNRN